MSNFTSGKWLVADSIDGKSYAVTNHDDSLEICEVWGNSEDGKCKDDEALANAILLACSPELLAALEAVVAIADRDTEEFNTARAIIAKAKGITQ